MNEIVSDLPHVPCPRSPRRLRRWLVGLAVFLTLGIPGVWLVKAVRDAQEAARNCTCQGRLKQLGLALQNYHQVHGCLPPAYVLDKEGRKAHSWRMLVRRSWPEADIPVFLCGALERPAQFASPSRMVDLQLPQYARRGLAHHRLRCGGRTRYAVARQQVGNAGPGRFGQGQDPADRSRSFRHPSVGTARPDVGRERCKSFSRRRELASAAGTTTESTRDRLGRGPNVESPHRPRVVEETADKVKTPSDPR